MKQRLEEAISTEFSFKHLFIPFTAVKAIHYLIIIGLLVYCNSLFNGFVWDDDTQLLANTAVHNGWFFYYLTHTIGPYYRPLMLLFYTALYELIGYNPFFYHLVQVCFHIINTIFIFWLFKHFSKRVFLSFMLAMLFLIHPMSVEPVVFVANLQDVLFVCLGMSAFFIYINRIGRPYEGVLASIYLFLGLFAKETAILFVGVFIMYVLLFSNNKKLLTITSALSAAILYLIIRILLVGFIKPTDFNSFQANTIPVSPFMIRLITMPKLVFTYIETFIYPYNLVDQYWVVTHLTISDFYFPLLIDLLCIAILVVTGMYIQKAHNNLIKIYWFFIFWLCIGLGFHLQLIPLDRTVADRWFYFPMIGLLGVILTICMSVGKNIPASLLRAVSIFFLIVYCIFATRSVLRIANWYSDLTLFNHDMPYSPNNGEFEFTYATALLNNSQCPKAIPYFQSALDLIPNNYMILHNLGLCYLHTGNYFLAYQAFRKVTVLNTKDIVAYRALVVINLIEKNPANAMELAKKYLKIWPNDYYLWRYLGLAEYSQKNTNQALSDFSKSFSIHPAQTTQYYIYQSKNNLPITMQEL